MAPEDFRRSVIERFKEGDKHAFNEIYKLYCDRLYAFSIGLVKDSHLAQEIVQEVFIILWEKRHQINIDMNFDNYLITITHNFIKKIFRRRVTEIKVREKILKSSPEECNALEDEVIFRELMEIAHDSIEKLPPKRKEVYKMCKQDGLKIKEIAKKLNISTRTVEGQLAKAIKFLKNDLEELKLKDAD